MKEYDRYYYFARSAREVFIPWVWIIPESSHSIQWVDWYMAGYMGVNPIAEHTKDFWQGFRNGTEQVGWDKERCKNVSMRDHGESCLLSHSG